MSEEIILSEEAVQKLAKGFEGKQFTSFNFIRMVERIVQEIVKESQK